MTVPKQITIHNLSSSPVYDVVEASPSATQTPPERLIISMDGLFVLVAYKGPDEGWQYAGESTPEENERTKELETQAGMMDQTLRDVIPPTHE